MTATRINPQLVNFASEIDDDTLKQAEQTASMPFVYPHVALMPDAHFGKGSSVGTVIPTQGAVIPAAVGVDIGCGMIAARTTYIAQDLDDRMAATGHGLDTLRASIESAIPMSAGGYNKRLDRYPFTAARIVELDHRAFELNIDLTHSPKWREQLGTLGGGNHFIELCLDQLDRVWLFLHSGSRGVGNKIAQKHIKAAQNACEGIELPSKDLAYLTEGTPQFYEYLRELHWAQRFAYSNRAEMMDRFARAFANWIGTPVDDVSAFIAETINTHHNYTEQEEHGGRFVWLTRKGAIDAHEGVRGLIPGSMGHLLIRRHRQRQPRRVVLSTARRWPPLLPHESPETVHRRRFGGPYARHRIPARRRVDRRNPRRVQADRRRHARRRRAGHRRRRAAANPERQGAVTHDVHRSADRSPPTRHHHTASRRRNRQRTPRPQRRVLVSIGPTVGECISPRSPTRAGCRHGGWRESVRRQRSAGNPLPRIGWPRAVRVERCAAHHRATAGHRNHRRDRLHQ
ncbi:RtcB-like RNA ligase [Mycobacterium phage Rando14]|uniref:3'-phosphate/5'-hydroxy nucleic acid ligase n=1 Tax=Mycobacterium phage Rando14 TaxID=2301556 RepID=A0A385D546_9CAUD|nr:tRNA splicing ligase [Mycobacterium phage Rando14]AXQ53100.1 RtcB-like RNA ligase [Mycobacterium phage Rando14]